ATEAWAAVARAAEGVELDARDRAEIADHEAMDRGPEGVALFERAAELYLEAGDPGEALAARGRAAYIRALTGEVEPALAAAGELYDRALALYAEGGTGVRQTASVLLSRARVLMRAVHGGAAVLGDAPEPERATSPDPGAAEAVVRHVREILTLVDGHTGDDVRMAARAAEAHAMLAELAELSGDLEQAVTLFRQATGAFVAAGLPWFTPEYDVRVAALAHRLGRSDETEEALRDALAHGGPYLEPVARAQLHLQLAEVTGG
ncbi:tetratricopeptide repeat protein, partial [Streptomyces sp. SID4985]|nr:tetratricopeptide repeat protein [Streptomyces sp. SID4985]